MKIAVIQDWLVAYGGAEKVLEQILKLYPKADLFALYDFIPDNKRDFILNKKVNTSFLQKFPFAEKKYRSYLPLMPLAVEQFDFSKYDVIISVSTAVAKGIITGPDQLHIAYVNSPIRYAWDLSHQYLKEANLTKGPKSWLAKLILHYMRIWDTRTSFGIEKFIGNSKFIARRINKVYRRDAGVVYPPVNIDKFTLHTKKDNYYLTASRMVPYKKMDIIVEAFAGMPDKKLIVIGDGPDFKKIQAKATPNVTMMGYQPDEVLIEYMQKAKAFLFAAEEDFGIVPLEAQACGTPVIAFGKGGALETVENERTGIFFDKQDTFSIKQAVKKFEKNKNFDPYYIRRNAEKFSPERFRSEFKAVVDEEIEKFFSYKSQSSLYDQLDMVSEVVAKRKKSVTLKKEEPEKV